VRRNFPAGLNGLLLLGCLLALVAVLERERRVVAAPPSDATYIGQKKCRVCHFKEFRSWKKTDHAETWNKLPERYRSDADCLRCHVTGYGDAGGYTNQQETPHLTGVQCESCHGPGSVHAEIAKEEEDEKTIDALIDKSPQNRCAGCHTPHEEHPAYEKEGAEETSGGQSAACTDESVPGTGRAPRRE
jgi:hypothetical protein